MKHIIVPLSALIIYSFIELAIYLNYLPEFSYILNSVSFQESLLFMFIIIFLESIIYIGFYLPGQLIAVILVTQNSQGMSGIFLLTIMSFLAVTLSALINYYVGRVISFKKNSHSYLTTEKIEIKRLLLSMIHINTLALFMFEQGLERKSIKIVFFSGLLNIPYYFILILLTYYFKDEILLVAENSYGLFLLLLLWLGYGVYEEYREKSKHNL
ncbi:MAG: hypothetical protein ACLFPL_03010 [Candidatus Nanoarchaeia archaeon]